MGVGAGVGAGSHGGLGPANLDLNGRDNARARAGVVGRSAPSVALTNNVRLASRTQALLPAGMTVQQASSGFKNTGQFLAAAHVSHNLGIPFTALKTRMTGSQRVSLGRAIKELRPSANSKAEEKRAKKQADADLEVEEGSR